MKPSLADMCCVVDTHNLSNEGCVSTYYYSNMVLLDPPTLEDVSCLIQWPDNTEKYASEEALIKMMLILGKSHGFERLQQVANALKAIRDDPSKVRVYQMAKDAMFVAQGWDKNPPTKGLIHQFDNVILINSAFVTGDCKNCGKKAVTISEHVNVCPKEVGQ